MMVCCGVPVSYSERWDACYCEECLTWLEPACMEKDCRFNCRERPELSLIHI